MPPVSALKSIRKQLCFDFFATEPAVTTAKFSAPRAAKRGAKKAEPPAEDLRELCVLLHDLAKRHVAPSNFRDFNLRVRCTKLLETLGVLQQEDTSAIAKDQDACLVTSSPHFRRLRATAVACLATVADLAFRAPSKGTPEYQRGVRDAYDRASEIAALFLEDIQGPQKRQER